MEQTILMAFQSIRIDGLTQFVVFISALGDKAFIWILFALIFLIFASKRKTGILIIVTIVVLFIISELILEPTICRIRPCDANIGITAVAGVAHSGYSFPSGHAAAAAAAATVIALTDGRKFGVPAIILAVLISVSRLYLGVHYPSDVLAGALLGVLVALIVAGGYKIFAGYDIFGRRLRSKGLHFR